MGKAGKTDHLSANNLVRPLKAFNFQVTPHNQYIWEVTWKQWSHQSIYNKNEANNILSQVGTKIGFKIKNEIQWQVYSYSMDYLKMGWITNFKLIVTLNVKIICHQPIGILTKVICTVVHIWRL